MVHTYLAIQLLDGCALPKGSRPNESLLTTLPVKALFSKAVDTRLSIRAAVTVLFGSDFPSILAFYGARTITKMSCPSARLRNRTMNSICVIISIPSNQIGFVHFSISQQNIHCLPPW